MLAIAALMLANIGVAPAAAQEPAPDLYGASGAGVHADAVRSLGQAGVLEDTQCEAAAWCWSEPITRETAAVWLVRVLDGDDARIPPGATRFEDVDADNPWAGHIERLAQLEVTVGCSTERLRFCGDSTVTRAQMASFLTRGFDLEPADPAGFADTSGSVHAADIDALFAAGITVGCSIDLLRFCPSGHTTRAEMASFLDRARQHTANDTHGDEATTSLGGGGGGTPSGGGTPPTGGAPSGDGTPPTGGAPSGGGAPPTGGAPGATPPREAQPPESQRPGNASWLEVVQQGIDAVAVNWRPPSSTGASPISEYRLWWSINDAGFPSQPQAILAASERSYVIPGLALGDTVMVRLAAVNGAGQGPPSSRELTIPGASVLPGLDWFDVAWPEDPDASRFEVQWRLASGAAWDSAQTATVAAGATDYSVTGLSPNFGYLVRVRAINAGNDILWTLDADAGLGTLAWPSANLRQPEGCRGPTYNCRPHYFRLSWEAPDPLLRGSVNSVRVEWREDEQRYDASRRSTYPPVGWHRDVTLPFYYSDRYWVRFTILDDRDRVLSRAELSTVDRLAVQKGAITLRALWPLTLHAAGYEVQWKTSGEPWDTASSALVPDIPISYTITGLSPETRYNIRVRAITDGDAPWQTATATTADPTPRNLTISGIHGMVKVVWRGIGINSDHFETFNYDVQWRTTNDTYDTARRRRQNNANVAYAQYVWNLADDTDYYLRVRAVDALGNVLGDAVEDSFTLRSAATYHEQETVETYEDDWPWVRRAWNFKPEVEVGDASAFWRYSAQSVTTSSGVSWPQLRLGEEIVLSKYFPYGSRRILRWLAQHFIGDHRIDGNPMAVAAGRLYFEDRVVSPCDARETYAEALTWATLTDSGVIVLSCPPGPYPEARHGLIPADRAVVNSVGSLQVPQWFYDTYSDDGTDAGVDRDRLWAGIATLNDSYMVAYGFRSSFGGLCSDQEAVDSLANNTAGNPWVNGGCNNRRPQSLTASAGATSGEINVTWSAPLWSTTPVIDAYVVQWKTGTGTYNSTDSATVTNLTDLTHTITGLASGSTYTVRVAAVNSSDTTDLTDDDSRDRTAETTAAA